jgi:hypothetical protein
VGNEIGLDLTARCFLSDGAGPTSEELLILTGAYYVSMHTDEFNHARYLLKRLSQNKVDELKVDYDLLRQLLCGLKNVNLEVLLTHLFAFSIIGTPDEKDDFRIYFWDMPFDKEIKLQDQVIPPDILWVTDPEDILVLDLNDKECIGLDLHIDNHIVDRLFDALKILENKSQVSDVYVKYALLSHVSTLIRERGFNVISV